MERQNKSKFKRRAWYVNCCSCQLWRLATAVKHTFVLSSKKKPTGRLLRLLRSQTNDIIHYFLVWFLVIYCHIHITMDELPPGSQWDILMEALLADDGYLKVSDFQYHSELSTIGFLDRSPMVRWVFVFNLKGIDLLNEPTPFLGSLLVNSGMQAHWLSTSNEPRERTASRSTHYRNIGNDYHNNNADPDNLAANYFTKAVFSAPSKSIELAYAHANRAAALCRKSEFADVSPEFGGESCR